MYQYVCICVLVCLCVFVCMCVIMSERFFNIGSVSLIFQRLAWPAGPTALRTSGLFYDSMLKYASRDLKAFEVMKRK